MRYGEERPMARADAGTAATVNQGLDMDDVDTWSGLFMSIDDHLQAQADLAGMTLKEYLESDDVEPSE